jgi:hypothetical protein
MRSHNTPVAFQVSYLNWALSGATTDLSFSTSQYFGANLSNITCSRASNTMAIDAQGNWHSFGANIPAITNLGIWSWEARTNLFLNSQAPVTQTITVVNGSIYTISLYGTGSLVLSGAGTGTVTQGSPITIAAGSTSLTVTTSGITGAFINAQVELNPSATLVTQGFATPPIITTGSTATRAADVITGTITNILNGYSLYTKATCYAPGAAQFKFLVELDSNFTANNHLTFYQESGSGNMDVNIGLNGASVDAGNQGAITQYVPFKMSAYLTPNLYQISLNNGSVANGVGYSPVPPFNTLVIGSAAGYPQWNGSISRIAIAPVSLLNQ